jgi:endonuclease/exonuclease/phosphatase family metal-dependent hydrolase
MTRFLRRFTRKVLIVINILTVIAFLVGCCTSFLLPGKYWYVGVMGVGLPLLALALVLFILFWWFFKSKWAFLSVATLILGWSQVNTFFAFHPFSSFDVKKEAGSLRVMQWNVARFGQMDKKNRVNHRQGIFDYMKEMDPDVLCMEEFLESNNSRELDENIPYVTQQLKYPYYYFARDHARWDKLYEHGVAIFSRYPIVDTVRIRYTGEDSLNPGESLIHADIDVNGQRIRVFATHLQTLKFDGNDYGVLKRLVKAEDSSVERFTGVIGKFRRAYGSRSNQAELVRRELDSSPYPEIICGDFNDVPNSFTYFKIKGNRSDAFLKEGFGVSRTFISLSPTLRIDFILASKKLEVLQFKKSKLYHSDHFPIVADFKLPGKE